MSALNDLDAMVLRQEVYPPMTTKNAELTFTEWDDRYTSKISGFKDAEDYYAKCNSLQFIPHIKPPTLLVNSKNDPFLSKTCFPKGLAQKSGNFYLEVPVNGGHVGYSFKSINGEYYSESRAFEFVKAMLEKEVFT
jgi:predicted alpha/beta-fold hydrolase